MTAWRRVRALAGYAWAALCVALAPIGFIGSDYFSGLLARLPFMRVHPRYSGGEVARVVDHGVYRLHVHRPVFDSLFGRDSEGFVQLRWEAVLPMPTELAETVDLYGDGRSTVRLRLDARSDSALIEEAGPDVLGIGPACTTDTGWIVRVRLKRIER